MTRALSREAVRELDRRAIEEVGMPSLLLMENAGRACADEVEKLLAGGSCLCLCGPGNNGGDGLVIARTLWNRGHATRALFFGEKKRLSSYGPDVQTNARLWQAMGRELERVPPEEGVETLGRVLEEMRPAVIVDALFGTGLSRVLVYPWSDLVEAVNDSGLPVLAVDIPSGLDADTGRMRGAAIRAQVTVTFVAPKLGFTEAIGPACCGRIQVAEIGIPRHLYEPS